MHAYYEHKLYINRIWIKFSNCSPLIWEELRQKGVTTCDTLSYKLETFWRISSLQIIFRCNSFPESDPYVNPISLLLGSFESGVHSALLLLYCQICLLLSIESQNWPKDDKLLLINHIIHILAEQQLIPGLLFLQTIVLHNITNYLFIFQI